MATVGEVHVGDVGTIYSAAIQDAGATFDPSAAVTKELIFQTPAGVRLIREAVVSFVGGDWVLTYTLVSPTDDAFHAVAGVYRWQGNLEFSSGQRYHTNVETYRVFGNLD